MAHLPGKRELNGRAFQDLIGRPSAFYPDPIWTPTTPSCRGQSGTLPVYRGRNEKLRSAFRLRRLRRHRADVSQDQTWTRTMNAFRDPTGTSPAGACPGRSETRRNGARFPPVRRRCSPDHARPATLSCDRGRIWRRRNVWNGSSTLRRRRIIFPAHRSIPTWSPSYVAANPPHIHWVTLSFVKTKVWNHGLKPKFYPNS